MATTLTHKELHDLADLARSRGSQIAFVKSVIKNEPAAIAQIDALVAEWEALAQKLKTMASKLPAPGVANRSGTAWNQEEDNRLGDAYDEGQSIEQLSATHQRSKWAIEARLARLGKIPEQPVRLPSKRP